MENIDDFFNDSEEENEIIQTKNIIKSTLSPGIHRIFI